jgi:hypothetical protein
MVAMNAWPLKIYDDHTKLMVDLTQLNQTSLIQFTISRVNKDFLLKKNIQATMGTQCFQLQLTSPP